MSPTIEYRTERRNYHSLVNYQLLCFIVASVITLISSLAEAQVRDHRTEVQIRRQDSEGQVRDHRQLSPSVYRGVVRPKEEVQVRVNGEIRNADVTNVLIEKNSAVGIKYGDKAIANDSLIARRVRSLQSEFKNAELKLIPEIQVQTDDSGNQRSYHILFTALRPLVYDFKERRFSTKVNFVLIDNPPGGEQAIKEIPLEITSNSDHKVDPKKDLHISHVSIPSTEIIFNCNGVNDSVNFKVLTQTNPTGYEAYLRVEPATELSTSYSTLQGWGLQVVPLTVRFIGTTSNESTTVSFNASEGSIEPQTLSVKYNQPAVVYLRSGSLGKSTVTAISGIGRSEPITLTFAFPWAFAISSIVGGLAVGIWKGKGFFDYVKSVVAGLVVAILVYALGVQLDLSVLEFLKGDMNTKYLNAAGAVGVSAIGGFLGWKFFDKKGKAST